MPSVGVRNEFLDKDSRVVTNLPITQEVTLSLSKSDFFLLATSSRCLILTRRQAQGDG